MAINFTKHREALLNAWKDVVDDSTATDWALFGYEKQSNDLTLVEKGDGGLSELLDELNSGKIMYAFCRVLDSNTSLHKFVLINWQGEGAPLSRKGCCVNHFHDVSNFFKGAHVTLNARTEDDVEPSVVLEKVAKSTGSKFNFQERSEPEDKINPVSSVYKRIQPSREINAAEREKFWMKEQEQEKRRVEEEKRKAEVERLRLDNERKERELKEAMDREERVKERSRSIAHVREAEHNAQNTARNVQAERMHWERQMQENARDESERRFRSDHVRRERSQEAQALISQRKINARAIFEQNSCAGQMSHFGSQSSREDSPGWTQQQPLAQSPTSVVSQPTFQEPPEVLGSAIRQNEERYIAHQTPAVPVSQSTVISAEPPKKQPTSFVPENTPSEVETNRTSTSPVETRGFHYTGSLLPPRQESEIEPCTEEEQNWDEPSLEEPPEVKDPLIEMLVSRSPQSQGSPQIITADGSAAGLKARALYDYQAADDTEISFDPDEVIIHIEQIDEGWWQGMAPDGSYGLFPANYVQLID